MLTIDEAIKHCEEVAEEQSKLCKRYDDASGYSRSHNEAIRTTDAKRCEECVAEHRQLAEWLKELKALREFAHYVAYSITAEEEEFNENPRFFGEAYCRKLHKLGIIKSVDNKWVYDEEVNADGR